MQIVNASQKDIWPRRDEYHVLTYAEEGFAPLNIHGKPAGLRSDQLRAFADEVNRRTETGSMHPQAPISAVPRSLIRDTQDPDVLCKHIKQFLEVNESQIKAKKLIFDFRTPKVPAHVMTAIRLATQNAALGVSEIVVISD